MQRPYIGDLFDVYSVKGDGGTARVEGVIMGYSAGDSENIHPVMLSRRYVNLIHTPLILRNAVAHLKHPRRIHLHACKAGTGKKGNGIGARSNLEQGVVAHFPFVHHD